MCGHAPGAGSGQIVRAIELITSRERYPVFTNHAVLEVACGSEHTYQYAIFSGGVFKVRVAACAPIDCMLHHFPCTSHCSALSLWQRAHSLQPVRSART